MRKEFNIRIIFGIAVCSSVLVYLFVPVFQKAAEAPSSIINAKILGRASIAYAVDYDDTFPRVDNNGSCLYIENPCAVPDSGVISAGVIHPEKASEVMYLGAITPYATVDKRTWSDPSIGQTDWQAVHANAASLGVTVQNYSSSLHPFYERTLSQAAVNYLIIEGPGSSGAPNRPLAPRGRLYWITNPSSKILMTMQSAWDWDLGQEYGLGNGFVWPSWANSQCVFSNSDGWTFYIVNGTRGPGMQWYGHPDRAIMNPNLQGKASFVFVDGHAEQLTYPQAEQCVPVPDSEVWITASSGTSYSTYYPKWVPEIP